MQLLGKYVIFFGFLVVVIGVILYLFGNHLSWLGKLPGDIRIDRGHFKLYFPITTMILISVILTLLIHIFRKIF